MLHKLKEVWWALPAASAALLVLAFHPFNLWPLAFIALVPLYYFVAAYPARSSREVFIGGFITGSVFALSLSYFTVVQFRWIPEAYLFSGIVHFGFIPIGLLGGLLCGGFCTLAYRLLRTQSILLNILAGAAAYTAGEMLLYMLCGGYYFAMLGYTAAPIPFFVSFAAVSGAFMVSFLVALINSAIAEGLVCIHNDAPRYSKTVLVIALAVIGIYGLNMWYLNSPTAIHGEFTVVTLQTASRDAVGFGGVNGKNFSFPALEQRLRSSGQSVPDLLIYPFSPVEGALYEGEKPSLNKNILVASRSSFLAWTTPLLPASTTLMVWTTLYKDAKFYNVFEFVQKGKLASEYRKRYIFPFIDYTPQWAQRLGFYTTQVDMSTGEDFPLTVAGIRAGAMLCSEIHKQSLARADAHDSLLLISAGSEAVFVDGVASEYSLKAAQFRAAETNLPAVRANILGPSAIIDRNGSVAARLNRGNTGELRGTLELREPHRTLYVAWGSMPLVLFIAVILGAIFAQRHRARYNI